MDPERQLIRHDRSLTPSLTIAVNAEYAAYATSSSIYVQCLLHPDEQPLAVPTSSKQIQFLPVLAISSTRPNLLAVADGARVQIWDVASKTLKQSLKANGRRITSLSLDGHSHSCLVGGTIDGAICFWDLDASPSRPSIYLHTRFNACDKIALHPYRRNVVATAHGRHLTIWSLCPERCVHTAAADDLIAYLDWTPNKADQLVSISKAGAMVEIDLQELLDLLVQPADHRVQGTSGPDRSSRAEAESLCAPPTKVFTFGIRVFHVRPVGERGWLILSSSRDVAFMFSKLGEDQSLTKEWMLPLHEDVDFVAICDDTDPVELLTCSDGVVVTHIVPAEIVRKLGLQQISSEYVSSSRVEADLRQNVATFITASRSDRRHRVMHCHQHDIGDSGNHLHRRRVQRGQRKFANSKLTKYYDLETPPNQSMTSSLELPKTDGAEDASPMPFLSPAIPARRGSSNAMLAIDESLQLPAVARASFDSMLSHADHDSDSDDEGFSSYDPNSGNLFLGGANMPLPRTCGATFGPDGSLVTFSMFRSKPVPSHDVEELANKDDINHISELARLFPSFGSLQVLRHGQSMNEKGFAIGLGGYSTSTSKYAFQVSSYESQPLWKSKMSPVKHRTAQRDTKFEVRVWNSDILDKRRRLLAKQYRVHCQSPETLDGLCRSNATHATASDMHDVAHVWSILGLLLAKPCLPPQHRTQQPIVTETNNLGTLHGDHAQQLLAEQTSSKLKRRSWSNHPLGRAWAIRSLLRWAEQRADIQLLASLSALMISPAASLLDDGGPRRSSISVNYATSGLPMDFHNPSSYAAHTGYTFDKLQVISGGPTVLNGSSSKPAHSRASSRNPSLPTTPYFDSIISTPPLSFAAISRQGSRLSASGSASPEHSRASFGAAARSYAQSITDRFASYGSSPPFKKSGGSPNNELSSSVPTNSWTKSVSFASTTDTAKSSLRASSFAQDEDGYDSDRTIENGPAHQAYRSSDTCTSVKWKNQGSFHGDIRPKSIDKLLDVELEGKVSLWCRSYASTLRSWNLLIEAAELEKVSYSRHGHLLAETDNTETILPQTKCKGMRPTCSICFAVIAAAEHICPSCLHAAHTTCLEALLAAPSLPRGLCPTGCGCDCASLLADDHFDAIQTILPTSAIDA